MNIQDLREKSKAYLARDELFYSLIIICVGAASFGLGRQSEARPTQAAVAPETEVVRGERAQEETVSPQSEIKVTTDSEVLVGSKNSDKYHLPWCSGAARIAEENKVYFGSVEEAKRAGYTPAANCDGL